MSDPRHSARVAEPEPPIKWATYLFATLFAAFEAISIHSVLVRRPATGAMLGAVLVGGIVFGMSRRPKSAAAQRSLLAGAAVVASVMALLLTAVLRTRLAEVQGVAPASGPFVQAGLLLTFQLGWAVTYWLSVVRNLKDQSRFIPAALGAVVLVGGGFMVGDVETSTEAEDAPGEAVYGQFVTAEDLAFATESVRAGEESGSVFAHYHTGRDPLLGVSLSTREWFRRERIDNDLMGIFDVDAAVEGQHRILAQPGYVVSAVEVQADSYINALRVQFAPFDGVLVSPFDRYWSEWVGSHETNQASTVLDVGSELVVGLRGSTGMVLNSMSLLAASPRR